MNDFTRTASGQSAYWFFNPKVILYVEGKTDINFYEGMIHGIECKIEKLNGELAGPKIEQQILRNGSPYLICYDGDYTLFTAARSKHRQIIRLSRYSFENYFWRWDLLNEVACKLSGVQRNSKDLVSSGFASMENKKSCFDDLLIMDVFVRNQSIGVVAFPPNIHAILKRSDSMSFCDTKILKYKESVKQLTSNQKKHLREISKSCNTYLTARSSFHFYRGHFVFSAVRHVIMNAVKKHIGNNLTIPDMALSQMMGDVLWANELDEDLRKIKLKVRRQLNLLIKKLSA